MKRQQDNPVFSFYQGRCLTAACFMHHVEQTRTIISVYGNTGTAAPGSRKLLNLCEDRYHFMVVFVAAMLEEIITVMPANQSQGELDRLLGKDGIMGMVDDSVVAAICGAEINERKGKNPLALLQQIATGRTVAELYTSGSTGKPTANLKTWGELVHGAKRVSARFSLNRDARHVVVATVPPQHMFGFEMSIILPLVAGVSVFHGKPFYPDDIYMALQEVPGPRILVTTPLHLKACMVEERAWPSVDFILSSTAVLEKEIAINSSTALSAPVREIYGCSEIGAIATRNTTETDTWELLGDFRLGFEGDNAYLHSGILAQPLKLSDYVRLESDGRFSLLGRAADLVKIGGKRGSMTEISRCIRAIPGVHDAVVFLPSSDSQKRERLVALVVAPGLGVSEIRQQLSRHIDAVFVPRQIYLVSRLPYSTSGKLPRSELMAMLAANQKSSQAC